MIRHPHRREAIMREKRALLARLGRHGTAVVERFAATLRPHGVWLSSALAAASPSSNSRDHDGGEHMLRVAHLRSVEAELALADDLGVRGVSYSGLPPEGDWPLLARRFQLRKRSSSLPHASSPMSPGRRIHA